jgi:hypothetical protein
VAQRNGKFGKIGIRITSETLRTLTLVAGGTSQISQISQCARNLSDRPNHRRFGSMISPKLERSTYTEVCIPD